MLWADEGFGVCTVLALQQRYQFPDNIQLMDGGTQGLYLLEHVQQLKRYEQERPSAESALRTGDLRVVLNHAYEITPQPGLADGLSIDVDYRGKY